MAYFRVEGTSRVSWSLLIEATSEDEATAIARRVAGRQSELRRESALQAIDHNVERPLTLGVSEPSNGRSPHPSGNGDSTGAGSVND